MLNEAVDAHIETPAATKSNRAARRAPVYLTHTDAGEDGAHRQAEQFYLQKQIQAQTPMVIVLEDGTQVEGVIEWYDRNCLKLRGRERTLVYKSAIKYMYKHGENVL
jgi:RNA chaperone Hfq